MESDKQAAPVSAPTRRFNVTPRCAICGKEFGDGHKCEAAESLSPLERALIHAVIMQDACDHFCCGMTAAVCRAKCIAKFLEEDGDVVLKTALQSRIATLEAERDAAIREVGTANRVLGKHESELAAFKDSLPERAAAIVNAFVDWWEAVPKPEEEIAYPEQLKAIILAEMQRKKE